ncbi:non-specific lipid-transfer protein c cotyledon-specific isoform [Phtheirospermum japonicum]|uniref:Non-specific lipid-transfer protein n=1 Tax=Phtheirospermum japonicum TaxID=374723 RepID=A0A830C875_9LAMI|nr:non-specific lipid-transfer protein c cotyledon-specific isoform [Phtheirospermum japonicum]
MFIILSLVYCFAQLRNAEVTCVTVDMRAASCITFDTEKVSTPPATCCALLQELARGVKTLNDKKAICRCLKAGVKKFVGAQEGFLSQIPNACKIEVGFPVSINTD